MACRLHAPHPSRPPCPDNRARLGFGPRTRGGAVLAALAGLGLALALGSSHAVADDDRDADADADEAAGGTGEDMQRVADWTFPQVSLADGQNLSTLVLPDLDGNPRALAEFHGRKVILHVFASW